MTVPRGFLITIASAVAFGCVGALAGFALGTAAPDYYRAVFRIPAEAGVQVSLVGLGLGATQGLAAGLIVGLVIVVTVAWFNARVTHLAKSGTVTALPH